MENVPLMSRKEASEFLTARGYRVAVNTLAKYASLGGGPLYRSFGRRPLYQAEDLLNWARERTHGPKDAA